MAAQLYLLELLPQSSAHAVSNTLGLDFIVAVTKPAQSSTIEEMEMTAIRVNKNVWHIVFKHSLCVNFSFKHCNYAICIFIMIE